ncbi:hypothetical protein [Methyloterricola oryzae]|uniref:hypothetical protein n=1 Tax=Methyloterricola oryzae TaxID=1495050 RepID=UPI000A7A6567|nr:hypothetical protein [Methyloterricola oryzae]
MKLSHTTFGQHSLFCMLACLSLPAVSDSSSGPDPYTAGFGFDLPQEAAWGGWTRGESGTLYAEWDVFNDKSHGGANDRTSAPDLGSYGTRSAWLGWNAGTFISGTGNLYSFTVPEVFSVNIVGSALPAQPLRVALQLESWGQELDSDSLALNGQKPAQRSVTYLNPNFPSPFGIGNLKQELFVWELDSPPEDTVFAFSSKEPHVSLTQVSVDIGPMATPAPSGTPAPTGSPEPTSSPAPEDPFTETDRTVMAKLAAENLDGALASELHAQKASWFPNTWSDQTLTFARKTDKKGRVTQSLKGTIKALFYHPSAGANANGLVADIYRPDTTGEVLIAQCSLKAAKKRRWATLTLNGAPQRLGTAVYRLDVQSAGKGTATDRIKARFGACDVDMTAAGVQRGIPSLRDGDYAALRRQTD